MKKILPSILLPTGAGCLLVFAILCSKRQDWAGFGVCLAAAVVLLTSCLLEAEYIRLARKIDELAHLLRQDSRNKGNIRSRFKEKTNSNSRSIEDKEVS